MLPWLPENIATYGEQIDSLFYLIFWITTITFVLVQAALVFFLVKYRYRPGRQATYTHGHNTLEIAWTIAPSLILVFLALLSRAGWHEIKQTLPESKYTVEVTAKRRDGEVQFAVRDTGIGIAAADLPYIFERFWRADRARSRLSERGGFGLGLAISQWIAQAHGGTLTVQSRLHRGSTFTVSLPVAPQPLPVPPPEDQPPLDDAASASQPQAVAE